MDCKWIGLIEGILDQYVYNQSCLYNYKVSFAIDVVATHTEHEQYK